MTVPQRFLILTKDGIIAARDKLGRLPVLIGKSDNGHCVSFESFAYTKLGYESVYELGPQEIIFIDSNHYETLAPAGKDMKICAFLWSYYGYPNSNYEGVNVEVMRYLNGEIMARDEMKAGTLPDVDYVAGVPDSGIPHAIGYSKQSGKTFARPFVKYTPTWPRSFMPANQDIRNQVAKMKQIPVQELIEGKSCSLSTTLLSVAPNYGKPLNSFMIPTPRKYISVPPVRQSCTAVNI